MSQVTGRAGSPSTWTQEEGASASYWPGLECLDKRVGGGPRATWRGWECSFPGQLSDAFLCC